MTLEAIGLWNEPSNPAYWDQGHDPEYRAFGEMVTYAAQAIGSAAPRVARVLGGVDANDTAVLHRLLEDRGLRDHVDAVGVHGFPYDWSHFRSEDWRAAYDACVLTASPLPVWVTEAGASSYDGVRIQRRAFRDTQAMLVAADRLYWYSLLDLPLSAAPYDYFGETFGHIYRRHHFFGLFTANGWPKPAVGELLPTTGVVQWFQYGDHATLARSVEVMRSLGITTVRTGLSWADWCRPDGHAWLDSIMTALEDFFVFATLCFTPPSFARWPSTNNAACGTIPRDLGTFADFALWVAERYGQ
jgi:hypothetical protein